MKAALNSLLMIFLGLSLSFCSSSPKDTEDTSTEDSSYDDYNSSSTYDDIQGAAGGDDLSTDDYGSTDDYSAADDSAASSTDDLYMGGTEESTASVDPGDSALPIEQIQEYQDVPADPVEPASNSGFKDGFYNIGTNCNMRAEPKAGSANEGKIKAGKRLWVEAYNDGWVKVFKRSGPVFISKVCL